MKKCKLCDNQINTNRYYCDICKLDIYKKVYRHKKQTKVGVTKKDLEEFVYRLESRKGLASLEEMMVEMITLYNVFGEEIVDLLPVHKQLNKMWLNLRGMVIKN